MASFPGLAEEIGCRNLILPPEYGANLWMGPTAQSGLHFDWVDGLLMQVYGDKTSLALTSLPATPTRTCPAAACTTHHRADLVRARRPHRHVEPAIVDSPG